MLKWVLITLLAIFLFVAALFGGCAFVIARFPENPPMEEATLSYTVHYALASTPPFLFKYYLYTPGGYSSDQNYPLVLMLHGASRHMHGGIYAARSSVQSKSPLFVLVPIAPPNFVWASTRPNPLQAHGFARAALRNVVHKYAIDPRRIYVTGYSLGGQGAYGMLAHYPDLFAAAAPLCGYWSLTITIPFPTFRSISTTAQPIRLSRLRGRRARIPS